MSQQTVGFVVDRLLSDEDFRRRFARDPWQTLVGLYMQGLRLTPQEIDFLVQTNARMWLMSDSPLKGRAH
jgi:hypothetical protein